MITLSFAAAFAAFGSALAHAQPGQGQVDVTNTIRIESPTNSPTVSGPFGSGLRMWVAHGTSVKVVVLGVNTLLYDVQFSEEGVPSPALSSDFTSRFGQQRNELLAQLLGRQHQEVDPPRSPNVPATPGLPKPPGRTTLVPTASGGNEGAAPAIVKQFTFDPGLVSFGGLELPHSLAEVATMLLETSERRMSEASERLKEARDRLDRAAMEEGECRAAFRTQLAAFNLTAARLGRDGTELLARFKQAVSRDLHGANAGRVRDDVARASRDWLGAESLPAPDGFVRSVNADSSLLEGGFARLTEQWTLCKQATSDTAAARRDIEEAKQAWLAAAEFASKASTLVAESVRQGLLKAQGTGDERAAQSQETTYEAWKTGFLLNTRTFTRETDARQPEVEQFVEDALRASEVSDEDIDKAYAEAKQRIEAFRIARPDLLANASNLQKAYDTIMAAEFSASDAVRTASGGGKKIHVVLKPKMTFATDEIRSQLREVSFIIELRTYGQWEMDTSTGYFFSSLTDQMYELRGGNVEVAESRDDYDQSLGLLIHIYRRPRGENALAWSFGLVPAGSNRLQYLIGASYMFLAERRAVLTFGFTGGPVASLRPGFRIGQPPPTEGSMTQTRFRLGWFFGISYNLG